MYAFNYLYITDILSGLNLIEKWEMALFSPFVVLKYDLFFPFLLLHFLKILLFSCLLIIKINHTLVIMIHLQPFISLLWWRKEVGHSSPLFLPFSTSGFLPSLVYCGKGEGNLSQKWCCCGPSIGALWVQYSHVCSLSQSMFVGCLESFQGFLHCSVPWHRWLTSFSF